MHIYYYYRFFERYYGSDFRDRDLDIGHKVSLWKSVSFKIDHTDGEAVIMLAFQASGRGSTPLRCIFFAQYGSLKAIGVAEVPDPLTE
jgi:hypothetical protein